jgi:hypothetical protein
VRLGATALGAGGAQYNIIHTAVKYRLLSIAILIVASVRGQDRGPRGQRALDAEGGRKRATADRRLLYVFYLLLDRILWNGMQETSALPPAIALVLADGTVGRRAEAYQHFGGAILYLYTKT